MIVHMKHKNPTSFDNENKGIREILRSSVKDSKRGTQCRPLYWEMGGRQPISAK
jgi:hypothetical protein